MTIAKLVKGLSFYILAKRSSAMWEMGGPFEHSGSTAIKEEVTFGPFPDYVEFTYQHLRVGPEGDFLGGYSGGHWWIEGHEHPFSDVTVFVGEPA